MASGISSAAPEAHGARGPQLRSTQFAAATLAIHFYFVSYGISIVNIPSSLSSEADWVVGIVVGGLGLAGTLTRPLAGVWVDSGARERWLRIGGVGTVVAFVGYGLSLDPWIMLGFRALHGVAMGLFTTALLAMVASHIPARRLGVGVGLYQSGNAVAQLYAAPLAVWIALQSSFELSFFFGALAAGVALVVGATVRDLDTPHPQPAVPWRRREWVSRAALAPAVVFLTMTTTVGAVVAFLPLFVEERDLGNAGLYYTVWGALLLASRFANGALGDGFGRSAVILPSLVGGAASLLLLASAESQAMLLVSAAIGGVALGGVQVSVTALIFDRAAPASRGAAMATYTMAWDVGAVIGGVLLGFVVDATSYAFGFLLMALLPLIGIGFYTLTIVRPKARLDGEAGGASLQQPSAH
jgi:MFS family permease